MSTPEQSPQPEQRLTEAQETTLRALCETYRVEFDPNHYFVYPLDSHWMPGWCEGWLGGPRHANPQYAKPEEPAGHPTVYVGVSAEGEAHS
jgi:hypothetical protein